MSRRKQARPRSCKLEEAADDREGQIITAEEGGDKSVGGEIKANGDISHNGQLMAALLSESTDDVNHLSPLDYGHSNESGSADKDGAESADGLTHTDGDGMGGGEEDMDGEGDGDGASRSSADSKMSPHDADVSLNDSSEGVLPPFILEDIIENFPHNVGVSTEFPYPCYACDKSFRKRSHMQKHEQVHSADWQYSCQFCGKKFRHKRSRDRHAKHHTGDKKYKCIKCDAAFARSDHLKVHYRTHDQFKPYKCTLCNRSYSTPLSLTIHVSQHNDLKSNRTDTYRCGFCRTTYEETKDLQEHIQTYHKCVEVLEVFDSDPDDKDDIEIIEDSSFDSEWKECTICAAVFQTDKQLSDHMISHQSEDLTEPPMKHETPMDEHDDEFEQIGRQFVVNNHAPVKTENDVNNIAVPDTLVGNSDISSNHASIIANRDALSAEALIKDSYLAASLHVCPYCFESSFSTLELLEVHMQSVHSAKPRNIYTCNYCNAPYQNLYSLHEHMRVVHKNKPNFDIKYPCSACEVCFSSLEELAIHKEESHSGSAQKSPQPTSKSPTSTTIANVPKYTPVHYTKHDTKHEPPAPEHPVKSSKRMKLEETKLIKLEEMDNQIEEGELIRSDTCFRCNTSFSDSSLYVSHMRSHFNDANPKDEPYTGDHRCNQCGKGFMSEKLLQSHIYSHFLVLASKFACSVCEKSFPKPDELQKHLMDIHAHHLYRCSLCKMTFDSKVNIQVHFAVKHSNESRSFKCVECCVLYGSEQQFKSHVQTTHMQSDKAVIRCLFCSQSFTNDFDLQCHVTTHQKSFRCTMCTEAFHVEFLLDKHIQEVHSVAETTKIKTEIDENDRNKEVKRLLQTPRVEYGASRLFDRKFVCNICDLTLPDFSSLQQHKLNTHSQLQEHLIAKLDRAAVGQDGPADLTTASVATSDAPVLDSCTFCSHTFRSRHEMDKHMKIHVNSGHEKCSICDESFDTASSLAEHKLQHCKISQGNACVECKKSLQSEDDFYSHSQEHGYHGNLMQCVICRQTLSSISELQMHGKYHFQTKAYIYSCCVCTKLFNSKENLIIKHSLAGKVYYLCKPCFHDDQIEFACPECPLTFPTREQLKAHRTTHRKTYQCIKCQESFNSVYEIKLHVASHMIQEGNTNVCNLCNETFDSPARLQSHLIDHSFENNQIICHVCGMLFQSTSQIRTHALTHGNAGRKHKCSQCAQTFFFSAELSNHVITEHSSVESTIQTVENVRAKRSPNTRKSNPGSAAKVIDDCDVCHKSFATLSALISHKKIHDKVDCEDLTCSLCQKSFDQIAELQKHTMSVHQASKDSIRSPNHMFKCPECDKEFPKMSSLQGHSHIHKTGKKFSCPLCRKVFTLASNLKIHLQCHTSDKPFACCICHKTFSRKENMQAHVKSHSGIKPFSCKVCDKSFARNTYLREHMRVHFPDSVPPHRSKTKPDTNGNISTNASANADHNSLDESLVLVENGGTVFPNSEVQMAE